MLRRRKVRASQVAVIAMLGLGIVLTTISAFYASSFLAILGVGIVFWGAILMYITPSKHVPLTLLNSSVSNNGNIERILSELNLNEKGLYLPPKCLKDFESSVVYIPEKAGQSLPVSEDTVNGLISLNNDGVFLTPPGLALSKLLEKELEMSFTKINISNLQASLPRLLIENMELAENVEMEIRGNTISVDVTGNVLDEVCQETNGQPRTHAQVGCLLSSAIACAFAKASGEFVTLQKETQDHESKTIHIEYGIGNATPNDMVSSPILDSTLSTPNNVPSAPLFKPPQLYGGVVSSVLVGLNLALWFLGWRLYDACSIWKSTLNIDYQNILVLTMAASSLLILALTKTRTDKILYTGRIAGLLCGAASATWAIGWLLYAQLHLWPSPSPNSYTNYLLIATTLVLIIILTVAFTGKKRGEKKPTQNTAIKQDGPAKQDATVEDTEPAGE
jgi:hypothetical protein